MGNYAGTRQADTPSKSVHAKSIYFTQSNALVENAKKKYDYIDVYESFSEYRQRRAAARIAFRDDKIQAKLQKSIEGLGLKSANEEDSKRAGS